MPRIAGPNYTATFKYDALNRRIEKTVNASTGLSTGSQTIQYLYDGVQAIAEITGSAITATYITGLQLDEVLARYAGSGNKTLLTDALGSVIAQTNDQQGIQNFYAYTPYGETQPLGPDDNNPIQYTARENDQTGLYYYRARYYDPALKRFIQEDPVGLQGGLNVYAYVDGNPISNIDPLGLWSVGFEAYAGLGGGITLGRDPNTGQWFVTFRGGYGVGGGYDFDPLGKRPGSQECKPGEKTPSGEAIGVFGKVGGRVGPVKGGLGFNAGFQNGSLQWPTDPYGSFGKPKISFTDRARGINASAAAGVEFTVFGKGTCGCQ